MNKIYSENIDYTKKNIKELKRLCKDKNIKGISKSNKQELINKLQNNLINDNSIINLPIVDLYTKSVLLEQYNIHKNYVIQRIESSKKLNLVFRLPSIPEDISENIIKFIIHKNGDNTSSWNCKGDLLSSIEGKQECKCFTSKGPISFTPSSNWDCIYFLDATNWLNNTFILYKYSYQRISDEWKNIKINKNQTFEQQSNQSRRPRICWNNLYPQIKNNCNIVFNGSFDDIIT